MKTIKEAAAEYAKRTAFFDENSNKIESKKFVVETSFEEGAKWELSNRCHDSLEELNIKNFWDASIGTWHQIDEIPYEFHQLAISGNSTYFTNDKEDTVVRRSDHWGSGIRECNWYLDGHPRNNSFLFSKRNKGELFIGIIKLENLINVRGL
jgi:hypothetical protein